MVQNGILDITLLPPGVVHERQVVREAQVIAQIEVRQGRDRAGGVRAKVDGYAIRLFVPQGFQNAFSRGQHVIRCGPEGFFASLTVYERSEFYLNRSSLNSDFGPGTVDSGSALDVSGSVFFLRRGVIFISLRSGQSRSGELGDAGTH